MKFDGSVKLREIARNRELMGFSKLLLPVAIFGPATPLLYATCSFKSGRSIGRPWPRVLSSAGSLS